MLAKPGELWKTCALFTLLPHLLPFSVLKKKLTAKGIQFEENTDQELMKSMNFVRVPVLDVDGKQMDFAAANNWINEQENVQ